MKRSIYLWITVLGLLDANIFLLWQNNQTKAELLHTLDDLAKVHAAHHADLEQLSEAYRQLQDLSLSTDEMERRMILQGSVVKACNDTFRDIKTTLQRAK